MTRELQKKVKIVATLGPAVETRGGKKFGEDGYWDEELDQEASAKTIASLIDAGANVFRFNFSHGDHAEHAKRMETVRMAEKLVNKKVGFLLDTKGPEIRTELFEGDAKSYDYHTGDQFRVATKQGIKSTKDVIALNVAGGLDIFDDVSVGQRILIDDGKLGLTVTGKDADKREFLVTAENDEIIAKQKGVNIPNTKIPFPALADRDDADIRFGLEQGINYISISFVRTAKDVNEIRAIMKETGNEHVQLFPKIENQQGIDNIDEIIDVSDGIMVARGDMGIEVPFEMVPVYQKMIITKCAAAGKPVITATNMLESMTEHPRATRSEISDVFNAVIDGTDATMLSGESANGKYPREAVQTMATVDKLAQTELVRYGRLRFADYDRSSVTESVASAVRDATRSMDIKLIVALTESGNTARAVAKYRPNADILAVVFDEKTERALMVNWGVIPTLHEKPKPSEDMFALAESAALESGLVESGDNIVLVAGVPVGSGRTNSMRIVTVK
ncbi:MAG: pyruvate kinase [Streptococcaceae bacterium]|jgi:pyruvate kinase|nr:pyruvate kinase [Streptococcaceae bacterium]